jgi:hypothetical protein
MSLGRRSLSCLKEQLKSFFSSRNNMSLGKRNLSCLGEQLLKKIPRGKIMSPRRRGLNCPKGELNFFFLKEQSCSQGE